MLCNQNGLCKQQTNKSCLINISSTLGVKVITDTVKQPLVTINFDRFIEGSTLNIYIMFFINIR